jgi:histidyl-tRNA synthetase
MSFPQIKEAKDELDHILAELRSRGINNASYDESIIRGFDYYTGTVFEVFDTDPQNNRSLFGGGRYDNLLSLFGDDSLPAFGFGKGDVTIRDFLETHNLLPSYVSSTEIMVCPMNKEASSYADEVAKELRDSGKNVCVNYTYKSIGDQIKSAEKQSIPNVIIIGENEVKNKTYTIKNIT